MSGLINENDTIETSIKKAQILIEALPYIRKLNKKRVVIKYGGNAMINDQLKTSVMNDITLLKYVGIDPIVVHGGGPDITGALNTYNIESKFINGLRVTDSETAAIARMVLVGKTNKDIVSRLNHAGGRAIGLCGLDGNLIKCKKLYTEVDGKKVDSEIFAEAFLSIPLTEGTHEIELRYTTPGLATGALISLAAVGLFILSIAIRKWNNRRMQGMS